jgi:hypothetical protein
MEAEKLKEKPPECLNIFLLNIFSGNITSLQLKSSLFSALCDDFWTRPSPGTVSSPGFQLTHRDAVLKCRCLSGIRVLEPRTVCSWRVVGTSKLKKIGKRLVRRIQDFQKRASKVKQIFESNNASFISHPIIIFRLFLQLYFVLYRSCPKM